MNAGDAVDVAVTCLPSHALVCANGLVSRAAYRHDAPRAFYMLGSIGLAGAIGLGVALARPELPVAVFDGDGNVLMGLGALAMVGDARPENLLHVVFDNNRYEGTGGQPSVSGVTALERVAEACGYRRCIRVRGGPADLRSVLVSCGDSRGPSFVLVECESGYPSGSPRVQLAPPLIHQRFSTYLSQSARFSEGPGELG